VEAERKALDAVLMEIDANPTSEFACTAFLEMLRRLPPLPRIPRMPSTGQPDVFLEFACKGVILAVELVLFRNEMSNEVLLTYREDEFFTGWHFPGTYRAPRVSLLEDAQRCADNELCGVRITKVRQIGFHEHPESPRFHDAGMLVHCHFEGTPQYGKWFERAPQDLIPVHEKYWEVIKREQGIRRAGP